MITIVLEPHGGAYSYQWGYTVDVAGRWHIAGESNEAFAGALGEAANALSNLALGGLLLQASKT